MGDSMRLEVAITVRATARPPFLLHSAPGMWAEVAQNLRKTRLLAVVGMLTQIR